MDEIRTNLIFGEGEYEDWLIGDEESLRKLIKACEIAIEQGEYMEGPIGDFSGIKMETNEFFDTADPEISIFGKIAALLIFCIVLLSIVVGAKTIFDFVRDLF